MTDLTENENRYDAMLHTGNLPIYHGERNPSLINRYCRMIRTYFIPDDFEQQRRLFVRTLEEDAGTWVELQSRSPTWNTLTGEEILEALRKHFFPDNFVETTLFSLWQLRQGSTPLSTHLNNFQNLLMDLPQTCFNDQTKRAVLLFGLHPRYAVDARKLGRSTYESVLEYLQSLSNVMPTPCTALAESSWVSDTITLGELEIRALPFPRTSVPTANDPVTTSGPQAIAAALGLPEDPALWTKSDVDAINACALADAICYHCKQRGHLQRNCGQRRRQRTNCLKTGTPVAPHTDDNREKILQIYLGS